MADNVRRVLIVGATGNQGGAVVDALLARDETYEVRGLTRHPESEEARALSARGVTVVKGDLDNKDTHLPAVENVDAVFCVTNFWTAGYDRQIVQGKHMADASAEAGVDHFVFSGVGSHDQETGIPHFDSSWEIDQYIQQLDLPATILKPVFFFQNFEGMREDIYRGKLEMPLEEGVLLQMIDVRDIGRAAAQTIAHPEAFVGERYDLAGDEHTLATAASVFSSVIGEDVEPVHVPIDIARGELGEEYAVMFEWFNDEGYQADIEAMEDIFGFRFATLEEYLRDNQWHSA